MAIKSSLARRAFWVAKGIVGAPTPCVASPKDQMQKQAFRGAARSSLLHIDPRVFAYERKLVGLAKQHSWSHALQVLEEIQGRGMAPSDHCYSAAFAAFNRSSQWQTTLKVFGAHVGATPGSSGHCAGVSTYNAAISAFARGSNWEAALATLALAQRRHVILDNVTYSTAIHACAESSAWSVALVLLSEAAMQRGGPSMTALGSAITAQEKCSQWERAVSVLSWALTRNMKPNVVVRNAIISACGSASEWEAAISLFSEMNNGSVHADIITYNAVIRALTESEQSQKTLLLYAELQRKGLAPTSITHMGVIGAFAQAGAWEHAIAQLRLDIGSPARDKACWTAAIGACAKRRQWVAALALLRDLPSCGQPADATAFNAAIAAFAGTEHWERSLSLFSAMHACNVVPDMVSYRIVLGILWVNGAPDTAVACFREGVDAGVFSADTNVVDFHRFPVDVARIALACAVIDQAVCPRLSAPNGSPDDLVFIVGRGTHSAQGLSVLSPIVLASLLEEFAPALDGAPMRENIGRVRVSAQSIHRWATCASSIHAQTSRLSL